MNHKADAESDTPSPSGFGIHILCVLVVCIPVIIILYPIIVFVSDPFGGSDECHWALQNQPLMGASKPATHGRFKTSRGVNVQ